MLTVFIGRGCQISMAYSSIPVLASDVAIGDACMQRGTVSRATLGKYCRGLELQCNTDASVTRGLRIPIIIWAQSRAKKDSSIDFVCMIEEWGICETSHTNITNTIYF